VAEIGLACVHLVQLCHPLVVVCRKLVSLLLLFVNFWLYGLVQGFFLRKKNFY